MEQQGDARKSVDGICFVVADVGVLWNDGYAIFTGRYLRSKGKLFARIVSNPLKA